MRRFGIAVILSTITAVSFGLSPTISAQTRSPRAGSVFSSLVRIGNWVTSHSSATSRKGLPILGRLGGSRPAAYALVDDAAAATVETDKSDYLPDTQVNVSGSGWLPGDLVELTFTEIATMPPGGYIDGPFIFYAPVQPDGTITNGDFYTDEHDGGVTFLLTAKAVNSGQTAQTTFTDSLGALSQCANGQLPGDPTPCQSDSEWDNGNLGASKSHYVEGDSIPYRLTMSGLSLVGSHTVTIEWDTTKSGKHAIDYLTTFNRSVGSANPCAGIAGCSTFSTFTIPADPQVTGAGVSQIAGLFRLYGGTITSVSSYSYPDGAGFAADKSAQITITFTTVVTNPVLAWGGHIATRLDWNPGSSAVAISGSPYHTRLKDIDGTGGNQDRSLSADAVIFPGSITVIKEATPQGTTSFPFVTTSNPTGLISSSFSLVDNGTSANTATFSPILVTGNSASFAITENTPANWNLGAFGCVITSSDNGGSSNTNGSTANITMKEGENWTCTFNNTIKEHKVRLTKSLVPTTDPGRFDLTAAAGTFEGAGNTDYAEDLHVAVGTTNVTVGEVANADSGANLANYTTNLTCSGGGVTFTSGGGSGAINGAFTMPDADVSCTITNTRKTHSVTLIKHLSPTNDPGLFNLTAAGTTVNDRTHNGQAQNASVGVGASVSVSEAQGTNTTLTSYSSVLTCVGVSIGASTTSASFTMPDNDVTCTVTNTRKTHSVTLIKHLSPTDDTGVFNLTAAGTIANDQGHNGQAQNSSVAVGTANVGVSETAGTGTSLSNYTSSLTCDNGASGTSSATFTMPDADVTCTVTNTRKTHSVTVIKHLSPTNDGGLFNLTAAGTTENDQGHNGQAQNTSVAVGTTGVSVSEAAGSNTTLGNYTSVLTCVGVSIGASTTSASFTMPDGDVTCTVTNTRKTHSVTLTKSLSPSNDPGRFDLTAAGTTTTNKGDGGSAQNSSVAVGATNVTVSEIANVASGANLANYTTNLTCTGGGVTFTSGGGSGTTTGAFTMPDADVNCTITNTRKTHSVTLIKHLSPTNDLGLFNLTAATTTATDRTHNGQAQNASVAVGTTGVSVSEAAGTNTTLTNYTSVLTCEGVTIGASTTSASFTMPDNDVTCIVTNTRKTHSVTLIKHLSPANDVGKFNLTAAGTTANDQGHNGQAQSGSVAVGTTGVSVSEAAGTNTTLANYTSVLTCEGVTIGASTTSASFTMPDNDVTCTVTNTRKTHSVTLTKSLSPTNDPGRFDLTAAGTTTTNQGNGGSAQNSSVAVGTTGVSVSEIANVANGASLANYTTNLTCTGGGVTFTSGGGNGATSGAFTMPDADVSCTITNTRKTHSVTLIKHLSPTNDGGKFNLTAAGTTANDQVHNGQAQNASVAVGTTGVSVSEAAGTGTSLTNYTASLSCDNGASGTTSATFTMPDANVTCTVTNTRKTHSVKLIKSLVPATDTGKFNLLAAGASMLAQGDGGFAENPAVAVGSTGVSVSEAGNGTTSLTNYVSSLSCPGVTFSAGGGAGATSGSFTMPNADVVCTITNSAKGKAQVVKTVNAGGAQPPATFDFDLREGANSSTSAGSVLATGSVNGVGGGTINFTYALIPGNHYQVCEKIVTPGWFTTLGPNPFALFNPGGVNVGEVCVDFVAQAGQTTTFNVNNFFPSTQGLGSTIGFWKNWASCSGSNGGQKPRLDQTLAVSLALAPPPYGPGVTIGILTLKGNVATPNVAPDCVKAVDLLNKSTIANKPQKMSSDPAFNMAAQLLGAILNVDAGAAMCTNDQIVVNYADTLLAAHKFNGLTYTAFTAAEASLANSLATLLDKYNNNGPCPAILPFLPAIPATITSVNTVTFHIGTSASFQVTAVGFPPPTFAIGGVSLPAGVSFNTSTGLLSYTGGASVAGNYNLTFTATNSTGGSGPAQTFTLKMQ